MKTIYFLLVLLTFSSINIYCQEQTESNPLEAAKIVERNAFGIYAALGQNQQSGISNAAEFCPSCQFENATKFGYSIGLIYEYSFEKTINIGATLGLDMMDVYSSFREKELVNFDNKKYDDVPVWFKNESNIKTTYLATNIFFKYQPVKFFFMKIGLNLATPLNMDLEFTKSIVDNKIILKNGEIVTPSMLNDNGRQHYEIPYPQKNSFVPGFTTIIGFNIPLAKTTFLSPYFEYYNPLGNISNYGDNFQIKRWRLGAEVKYTL